MVLGLDYPIISEKIIPSKKNLPYLDSYDNMTLKDTNIIPQDKNIMLTSKEKQKIIGKHKAHEKDTGSSEIQAAIFTEQIEQLTKHLKKHPKDNHSRRGLLKMVMKRKRLLEYLKDENEKKYNRVVKKLGLKK